MPPLPITTDNPGHCWLCGELQIESNLAKPGEPACRMCGCRPRQQADSASIAETKSQIRGIVSEIQHLAAAHISAAEFGPPFLERVTRALAACGAILWKSPGKKTFWSATAQPSVSCAVGQVDGPEFASRVIRENLALVIPGTIGNQPFLLIGVPISNNDGVIGALEIVQRPGAHSTTQRGYLRFAQQIVELVAGAQLFS